MELRRWWSILRRWWWLLVLGVAPAVVAAVIYTTHQRPMYRATTRIYVGQGASASAASYSDILLAQQQAKTYSVMLTEPDVIAAARQSLSLPDALFSVSAAPVQDTNLIELAVTSGSAQLSQQAADAIAAAFIAQETPYLPQNLKDDLRVVQRALLPAAQQPPLIRNAALAGATGVIVAVVLIALLEYLDDTVKSAEDLQRTGSIPLLGSVMTLGPRVGAPAKLLIDIHPTSIAAEAYRLLRTNLDFAAVEGKPVRALQVTSALPREGKSTTVANLAIVLAQAGRRVLIVDADLRRPSQHLLFGIGNRTGLSNLLVSDAARPEELIATTEIPNLRVLTSGALPPNPAELLALPRFTALLARLEAEADIVVLDTPPALPLSDSIIIASRVDGTLLVVDSRRARSESVRRAVIALRKADARILGAVLNKLGRRGGSYYTYGGYGSPYYSADARRHAEPSEQPAVRARSAG